MGARHWQRRGMHALVEVVHRGGIRHPFRGNASCFDEKRLDRETHPLPAARPLGEQSGPVVHSFWARGLQVLGLSARARGALL